VDLMMWEMVVMWEEVVGGGDEGFGCGLSGDGGDVGGVGWWWWWW
jgi:hypothetical protein